MTLFLDYTAMLRLSTMGFSNGNPRKKRIWKKSPCFLEENIKAGALGVSVYSIHYTLNFHPWNMNLVKISLIGACIDTKCNDYFLKFFYRLT
jgi:hypothetical protein